MRRDVDDEEVDDDDEGGGYGTFIVTFASRMKTIASFILVNVGASRAVGHPNRTNKATLIIRSLRK